MSARTAVAVVIRGGSATDSALWRLHHEAEGRRELAARATSVHDTFAGEGESDLAIGVAS